MKDHLPPTSFGGLTSFSNADSIQTTVVPCNRRCEPAQRYVSQNRQLIVFAIRVFDGEVGGDCTGDGDWILSLLQRSLASSS